MKRSIFYVLLLSVLVWMPTKICAAQDIKDAFILVDVSGSMKSYSSINNEAKSIISDMLQGNLDLTAYAGWNRVPLANVSCSLADGKENLLSKGGKVCLIPFGDMNQVRNYSFIDVSNFESSFNSQYPRTYTDQWTYITLAKAFTVHIATEQKMFRTVYMIIYSDGAQECVKSTDTYPSDMQQMLDVFGTQSQSFAQKKAIIRHTYYGATGKKNFDIEIWKLGPIPETADTISNQHQTLSYSKTEQTLEIFSPTEGGSVSAPNKISVKDKVVVKWQHARGSVAVKVLRKNDSKYKDVSNKGNAVYEITKKSNTATLIFHESGLYQIKVTDNQSSDSRYVDVSSDILGAILPFLFIVFLVVIGIFMWKKFRKSPGNTSTKSFGNNDKNSSNDDLWT